MTKDQVITGVFNAVTRGELTEFLDKVELADTRNQNTCDLDEWCEISLFLRRNINALDNRVFH